MLSDLLDQACIEHADKVALVYQGKNYTYAQLKSSVDRLASAFIHLKLQSGDKIAFFLTNRPEAILCFLACFKLGITIVPIRQFSKIQHITSVIKAVQPKLLITENNLLSDILALPNNLLEQIDCYSTDPIDPCESKIKSFSTLLESTKFQSTFPHVSDDTLATIAFTSGSTGNPKGIMHTQAQLFSFLTAHARHLRYTSADRILIYVPVSFAYSFSNQVLPALHSGATILLVPAAHWEEIMTGIIHQQATLLYVAASPISLINLLEKQLPFKHHLRMIFSAGDAMPIALHKRMQKIFNLTVCEGIGMTETWLYALNSFEENKLGSVGKPCSDMQIKIIDDHGNNLPSGCNGQIAVKGTSMMKGYFSDEASLHDGWLHTGDCGYLDEDGYLFFRGRKEFVINKNGTIIYPQEIEFALYEHPMILEAGVTSATTDFGNEKIVAYVALTSDKMTISKDELMQHLQAYLSPEKMPDDIVILLQLPKAIKIDRKQLKQLATNG